MRTIRFRHTLALLLAASSTTAAQSVRKDAAPPPTGGVVPGIEVLLQDSLHLLRGKRVGLITNQSGRDRAGRSTIDLIAHAPGVKLTALFALEHGIRGALEAGAKVDATVDSATGVPVYSLYSAPQHLPTAEMLKDVDVLVYDVQDVGARVYTYQWGMTIAADAANKPFIILDRPDPIRADKIDGGVLDPKFRSYVGWHPVAMRYGLTPGELLRYLIGTGQVHANLTVVPMKGYRRSMWYDETKLPWINPSPNLRDMDATTIYTGTVYFEGTNVSEGRGTDEPFRMIGAPFLTDAGAIASALNAKGIRGVRFDSVTRTIEGPFKFQGQTIPMIHVTVTDRNAVNPAEVGLRLLEAIYARHKSDFQWRTAQIDRLAGSDRLRAAVENGTVDALLKTLDQESRAFEAQARK
jgi:uncharacterized protein YbbC (DUF1343 family)